MDVPVDPDTLTVAVESLRTRIPARVLHRATIFTSPASRCLSLACELAAPRRARIVEELHEMHFGVWEGLSWKTVPRVELEDWAVNVWTYRPGGGESATMVAVRWRRCVARFAAEIAERGAPAIAVTHAGLIRAALAGDSRTNSLLALDVPFVSIHRLDTATLRMDGDKVSASRACT
jgi:alpha-ribazole phosphatase